MRQLTLGNRRRAVVSGFVTLALVAGGLGLWQGLATAAPSAPAFTAGCATAPNYTTASWTNAGKLRSFFIYWYDYVVDETHPPSDPYIFNTVFQGVDAYTDLLPSNGSFQVPTPPGAVSALVGWGMYKGSTQISHSEYPACS